MIHGTCGEWNNASPCLADRKCTKDYPKVLRETTSFSDDSYPLYTAEAAPGAPIMKTTRGGVRVPVSNAWVVPYNSYILLRYDAHINLEIVSAITTVKNLYKYLQKEPDQCLVSLDVPDETRQRLRHDEVTQYELGGTSLHLRDTGASTTSPFNANDRQWRRWQFIWRMIR